MKKAIIALGLVGVILFGITYAYARGPGFGRGEMGQYCQGPWGSGKEFSLTPEQLSKLNELRQKLNEETAQLRGNILTKRLELQSLWTNPKADPKAILEKEKELRDLQNQMKDKMLQLRLEARKILTPEQISKFGQGRMMNPGFGPGRMRGHRYGMTHGYGMGPGFGQDCWKGSPRGR
ncbi:MAG: Spy/CpxP family protein refolding chaperone [Thermodesulfobacteriota bacterium]